MCHPGGYKLKPIKHNIKATIDIVFIDDGEYYTTFKFGIDEFYSFR